MFVVADDLQYMLYGWINRNRILVDGEVKYITLPLKHASPNKRINDHQILDDIDVILRKVKAAYCKAPFFEFAYGILGEILDFPDRRLNYFLFNSLKKINYALGITTPVVLNSERNDDILPRFDKLIYHLCHTYGADTFINAIGGRELYSREKCAAEGIDLKFLQSDLPMYKQMRTHEFVPALSILDIMMNVPVDEIRRMLSCYKLVHN